MLMLRVKKTCDICHEIKSLSCFSPIRKKGVLTGFINWCKPCRAKRVATQRKKYTPEHYQKYKEAYARANRKYWQKKKLHLNNTQLDIL